MFASQWRQKQKSLLASSPIFLCFGRLLLETLATVPYCSTPWQWQRVEVCQQLSFAVKGKL